MPCRKILVPMLLAFATFGSLNPLAAEEAKPESVRVVKEEAAKKREAQLEARLQKLEAVLKEIAAAPKVAAKPAAVPSGRYQMLKAGDRVVILDTETGKTEIIEPKADAAIQNVEVGKAMVVVTVLGNVSQKPADKEPAE
ncbi:MAG: hypothetical protein KF777_05545 [Planctomycetaceae bacterium]|nr:hypothetical protein [Planctomycetaceae bacterium]